MHATLLSTPWSSASRHVPSPANARNAGRTLLSAPDRRRLSGVWDQQIRDTMPTVACSSSPGTDGLAFGPERPPAVQQPTSAESSTSADEGSDGPGACLQVLHAAAGPQDKGLVQLPPPAEPTVKLVTKLRVQPDPNDQAFWSGFMFKCRLAWDVFFPAKPQVLSPAGAVKSRLQMILVSDRCGLDLATLMQIKNSSMAALAAENGWEDLTELEVQVASIKPNGERMQMSLPLSSLPSRNQLRNIADYNYEDPDEQEEDYMPDEMTLVPQGAVPLSP